VEVYGENKENPENVFRCTRTVFRAKVEIRVDGKVVFSEFEQPFAIQVERVPPEAHVC
jgi:hypothetical protein